MDVRIRLVTEDDAACLAHLVQTNRAYLAPWEPVRDEEFFAEPGQRRRIVEALAAHARGRRCPA